MEMGFILHFDLGYGGLILRRDDLRVGQAMCLQEPAKLRSVQQQRRQQTCVKGEAC